MKDWCGTRRELVRLLSLYQLLVQSQQWDVGGNPTELKRDSVKTKGSCQGQSPQALSHTLSYLLKVFVVSLLMTRIDAEESQSDALPLTLKEFWFLDNILICRDYKTTAYKTTASRAKLV